MALLFCFGFAAIILLQSSVVSAAYRQSSPSRGHSPELSSVESPVNHHPWVTHPWPSNASKDDDFLHISITSSVHQLTLSVNGENAVDVRTTAANITQGTEGYTPWDLSTGLYLMVLHPSSGRLMMKRVLLTSEFGSSMELPSVLLSLTSGRILVIATKNDAALNLPKKSRDLLTTIGVTSASELQFRQSLAWVGSVGGGVWAEATISEKRLKKRHQWSSPVTLEVDIPKIPDGSSCFDITDAREMVRASFCDLYDGYGNLCSCNDPAPLLYTPPELTGSVIRDIPLIVIASNRPTYLYRCLLSLLRQAGGRPERILVMIDGYHQEVVDLLQLLQVPYIEHNATGVTQSAKISDHYRFSLMKSFSHFPKAPKVLLLEEDLLAAPDFFSFFNQTAWLLDVDPSLWCISAWNDLSALHVAHDARALRRVETLPGLGWMVTRKTAQELLSMWPSREKSHDWDLWARSQEVMCGRECVVPDVGRTYHFGVTGVHSPGLLHAAFFSARPVTALPNIQLNNVHRLQLQEYEEDLFQVLENDPFYLSTSLHPCHPDYMPRNTTGGRPVVVFIDMRTFIDYLAWKVFARCLGLWDLDTRASHRGLYRFFFYETEVFVIGYPYSDYSYLKPPWVKVMIVDDLNSVKKFDFMAPSNRLRFRRPHLEKLVPFWDIAKPVFPVFDNS